MGFVCGTFALVWLQDSYSFCSESRATRTRSETKATFAWLELLSGMELGAWAQSESS